MLPLRVHLREDESREIASKRLLEANPVEVTLASFGPFVIKAAARKQGWVR
jgi:hypothetical protein